MESIIKQFYNKLKTKKIYPFTKIKAVLDEDGNRLDNILNNIGSEIISESDRAKAAENAINNSLTRLDKAYALSVALTANTLKTLLLTLPDGVNSTDYIPIVTARYASHYNPLNVKVYNVYYNNGKLSISMLSTDTATYTFAVEFKKNGGKIS